MSSAFDSVDELGAMTVREFCDRYRNRPHARLRAYQTRQTASGEVR